MINPSRAGSITSGGAFSSPLTTASYSGVSAISRWSTVSSAPLRIMKRRSLTYDAQSLLSAVEAASSMMIGASTISASGKTTLPYAARCTSGSANRATTALTAGSSTAISSQLAASGHHVWKIRRMVTVSEEDRSAAVIGACGAPAQGMVWLVSLPRRVGKVTVGTDKKTRRANACASTPGTPG